MIPIEDYSGAHTEGSLHGWRWTVARKEGGRIEFSLGCEHRNLLSAWTETFTSTRLRHNGYHDTSGLIWIHVHELVKALRALYLPAVKKSGRRTTAKKKTRRKATKKKARK